MKTAAMTLHRRSAPAAVAALSLSLTLSLTLWSSPAQAQTVLKIATLAPEGSAWMKLFRELATKVEQRTEGRIKLKFYAGGVQGDERDVLRKMKLGQLSGAAITGIGLSAVHPEVRALELARTYEELDSLRAAFGDALKKKVEEKGYVLLAWGDVGPVHIFSNRPVKSLEDLKQTKMWLWGDDAVSRQFLEAMDIRGVPMGVPEVLPGLSTGQIDSFLSAPLPTLALQWGTKAKYMTSMVVSQATGATVVAKKAWDAIAAGDQKVLLEEARAVEAKLTAQGRGDNDKALEQLKARGLEVVPTPAPFVEEITRRVEAVAKKQGDKLDQGFRQQVEAKVKELRSGPPKAKK